jgi:hypothetical protein
LDLQRELPAGFFVDVAYAGSKGTHLPALGTQVDQLPDQYFAQPYQPTNTYPLRFGFDRSRKEFKNLEKFRGR